MSRILVLIKIADRNKDGWQVVEEYDSDDLARRLRFGRRETSQQTKDAISRNRRQRDLQPKPSGIKCPKLLSVVLIISFFVVRRGVCQKKSPLQKWLTWFIMTVNKENVNKSCVFVLA